MLDRLLITLLDSFTAILKAFHYNSYSFKIYAIFYDFRLFEKLYTFPAKTLYEKNTFCT